jgi:hypothetical protein
MPRAAKVGERGSWDAYENLRAQLQRAGRLSSISCIFSPFTGSLFGWSKSQSLLFFRYEQTQEPIIKKGIIMCRKLTQNYALRAREFSDAVAHLGNDVEIRPDTLNLAERDRGKAGFVHESWRRG